MSSSLVNSLAKVYDPNPLHGQKLAGTKLIRAPTGPDKQPLTPSSPSSSSFSSSSSPAIAPWCVETESRMDSLSSQMERLLNLQETVLTRLDSLSQDLGGGGGGGQAQEVTAACRVLQGVVQEASQRVEQQGQRLEGVERLVEGMHQVIGFIGEVVKSSLLAELLFNKPGGCKVAKTKQARKLKDNGMRDGKDKAKLSLKCLKAQKRKPPDASDSVEALLLDQVEKLNRQNAERSHGNGVVLDMPRALVVQPEDLEDLEGKEEEKRKTPEQEEEQRAREEEEEEGDIFGESEPEEEEGGEEGALKIKVEHVQEEDLEKRREGGEKESSEPLESSEELGEVAASSKRGVKEEYLVKDDLKKSRVEERKEGEEEEGGVPEGAELQAAQSEAETTEQEEEVDNGQPKEYIIDSSPPPAAPFDHRIVTPKPHQVATFYTINREEVLGGGRFGQVHKCVENSSGLKLAAKIIKAKSQKEKDVVKNEIQVMNQLNHANLIQLYAAFESRHDIILVMEYVDGGELFDRIIDENYNLTELDTVLFIRQICEGLQYMHKMYILHLDLKPENILCVSRATNKIKIIDFGLARRYKPREKLRINFGTPEFLAPEVINYEFVSFPTDMWSLGVITYMLLTGLSPFLGDDDNETLNNILACQWNFEEEEFTDISEEAKDFITRLLVKSNSWRMSASQSLKHSWLSDRNLHYRLHQKKNKCHSTHPHPPRKSRQSPIQNESPLQNGSQDPVGAL
ncbi:myosin light chain kinase 2, skeletal/cardiac muscle-like [Coregonus clupeaformis]|uniref:myosin light chain kinase 2, skeletal/cardiac muscle-like n=1 Tax=Coregonus clupeaformis TaxID=59861 RepID=UPI001E1C538F|nr:myosin light chain kinase 2, skeletal/cardiac muscle-like [Coregonus clupeaformis]